MLRVIFFLSIASLFLHSCRKNTGGGSGGYSGSVPTAGQVADWLRSETNAPGGCGDIQPPSPGQPPKVMPLGNRAWKDSWSKTIMKSLDDRHLTPLVNGELQIDQGDLNEIDCPNFNQATPDQKKQFWVLFMAAIAVPESSFNERSTYREADGSLSSGLLQIDEKSAVRHGCYSRTGYGPQRQNYGPTALDKIHLPPQDMMVGETNVACGLYVMRNQLMGGYIPQDGKGYYPGLKGKLFTTGHAGKYGFYWSVLNSHKQDAVKRHFRAHAVHQLPFCNGREIARSDLPPNLDRSMQRQSPGEQTSNSTNCREIGNEGRNSTPSDIERSEKDYFKAETLNSIGK